MLPEQITRNFREALRRINSKELCMQVPREAGTGKSHFT